MAGVNKPQVAATLLMFMMVAAVVKVSEAVMEPGPQYKPCYEHCVEQCKGDGNGDTFCEMKCDSDCMAKDAATKLNITLNN
ncbi:unnamed protein product [Linum tenue]|uniref:Major pollen allergen Ole e 6-like n=1 Tax=Linum tenue TaxID=586396 RepID=A0AAV0LJP7_9ROSI|nr:unnamed protein product [Linum tenue]